MKAPVDGANLRCLVVDRKPITRFGGYDYTANFQMPEEGYYSNDFDEILNITKEDDGTYRIEYSVTHLLYVENAIGTYDSETGILSFSGKDDRGNDIKAEIENKGDHLEVTVTQSNYEDIIGTKQEFFQADE